MVAINIAYLFDLDKVRNISMLIDTSLKIPRPRISPGSSCYQYICAILRFTLKVKLTNITVYDRHYPFLLLEDPIEVFDQIVVPEEMTLEGRVLFQPLFLETHLLELLVHGLSLEALLFG